MRSRYYAFTLIELLVVISIIALLIALLLPALQRAKEVADSVKCLSQEKAIGTAFAVYGSDHNDELPLAWEVWWGDAPGTGVGIPGQERNLLGIFKDEGYLPDAQAIWRCPADTQLHRMGTISFNPYNDYIDPFRASYAGSFNHHGPGWPTPPFSFPPGWSHKMEVHYSTDVYSPGNIVWVYDGANWPATNGSNAIDNRLVEWQLWPSSPRMNETMHRHAIDLPNILFCDGHATPFDLKDLRDPENWGIEGWNRN